MDNFNQLGSGVPAAADLNANEEHERPKVHYVCGGKLEALSPYRSPLGTNNQLYMSYRLRQGQHTRQRCHDQVLVLRLSHFLQEA